MAGFTGKKREEKGGMVYEGDWVDDREIFQTVITGFGKRDNLRCKTLIILRGFTNLRSTGEPATAWEQYG